MLSFILIALSMLTVSSYGQTLQDTLQLSLRPKNSTDVTIPCQTEFQICNQQNSPCQSDVITLLACIGLSNKYGCPQYRLDNQSYPIYGLSCAYNCFENMNPKTSQFQNLRNCVNANLPFYDRVCYTPTVNCLTDNSLNCVASLNDVYNCTTQNNSNYYCSIANNNQTNSTDYPAYDIGCLSMCLSDTSAVNGSPVFQNLQNCMTTFGGYECGGQFYNCLQDPSEYCIEYLNTALICSVNNTNCTNAAQNQESTYVELCNSQCFQTVNNTENSQEWQNLTQCLGNWETPEPPGPSPSWSSYSSNLIIIRFNYILIAIIGAITLL